MKTINEPQPELGVATTQAMPVAAQQPTGLTIEAAFHAASTRALDKESLAVMKDLLAMSAQQQFNAAFVRLQSELPTIVAKSIIPNRGRYEKFEDIMEVVAPLLTKHGFSVTFSMDFKENRILETCHLSHEGGHTRSNSFAVRAGKADSDTQADCKAATTAKRNALLNALNIVIRQDALQNEDDDATLDGDPDAKITPQQADSLRHRVAMLADAVNMHAFWKFARAEKFSDIPSNKFDEVDAMLKRKEKVG